jgi:quinolinate synthase
MTGSRFSFDFDFAEEINILKKKKRAIVLAHYYQDSAIQDVADYLGDSLGLSQAAVNTDADIIVFAGVHFMAETAKILCPNKKVLLPDLQAGCSLADACPPEKFKQFREAHPNHVVVSYINCSAAIKAQTDVVCTSSNAVEVVKSFPKEQPIIFAPDKNLGRYVMQQTGRDLLLWNGSCMVHELFSLNKLLQLKAEHPNAVVLAHPECEEPLLAHADFIGSTTALLKESVRSSAKTFIVATESGILHQMQKNAPHKSFIPAPPNNACACNECPHMKLNTLEKLYACLLHETPEIQLSEEIRLPAERSIRRMLEISATLGQ